MRDITPMLTTVKAIVEAAGKTTEFETAECFSLEVENAPFMRLIIESYPAADSLNMGASAGRCITVAHKTEDGVTDTDVAMLSNGAPLELTFAYGGAYARVYRRRESDGAVMVDVRNKREVESFLRMWSRNIKQQGFVKAARAMRGKACL